MNQKDLIYMKTIVEEGGITAAARKLFVSQPSLSQSVKRIEEELGVSLFRRTPKGLVLTQEGEEYVRMSNRILKIYDSFHDEIRNLDELRSGTVVVGATPHRGMLLFPEFLAKFHIKYPGITVKMVETATGELEKLLLDGKVDLAALREPVKPEAVSSITYHRLAKDSFLILLPKGHAAGRYAEVREGESWPVLDPKWLAEEQFLLPDSSLRMYESIMSILKLAGITAPKCVYRAFYMETLIHLVAAGSGVAIVSQGYCKGRPVESQLDVYKIPDSYGTFWEVSLATLKDAYLSRAAKKFIEEYTAYLQMRE